MKAPSQDFTSCRGGFFCFLALSHFRGAVALFLFLVGGLHSCGAKGVLQLAYGGERALSSLVCVWLFRKAMYLARERTQ